MIFYNNIFLSNYCSNIEWLRYYYCPMWRIHSFVKNWTSVWLESAIIVFWLLNFCEPKYWRCRLQIFFLTKESHWGRISSAFNAMVCQLRPSLKAGSVFFSGTLDPYITTNTLRVKRFLRLQVRQWSHF